MGTVGTSVCNSNTDLLSTPQLPSRCRAAKITLAKFIYFHMQLKDFCQPAFVWRQRVVMMLHFVRSCRSLADKGKVFAFHTVQSLNFNDRRKDVSQSRTKMKRPLHLNLKCRCIITCHCRRLDFPPASRSMTGMTVTLKQNIFCMNRWMHPISHASCKEESHFFTLPHTTLV